MLLRSGLVLLVILSYSCLLGTVNADQEALADLAEELSSIQREELDQSDDGVVSDESSESPPIEEDIVYISPDLDAEALPYFLYESFDDEESFSRKWTQSKAKKAESETEFLYDGEWALTPSHSRLKGDGSLQMKSRARHHAIAARTRKVIEPEKERGLILQYDVQFRNGQECGGAYIKLLAAPSGALDQINDKTVYSIMFGPDKCGNDYKLHFIFNHRNPKNGTLREIHWKKATSVNKLEEVVKDGKWHHFRLHLRNDNSFEIQLDKKVVGKGSLLTDFNPPVNPPEEIPDPNDSKPADWDEQEMIPDPDDSKPADWDENEPRKLPDTLALKPADWDEDEPEMVPDPESRKPDDWDPEMDGEWEAPLIANPKCSSLSGCGQWKAPLIDNPKYKGKWKPRMIKNPNYQGKWFPRKIPNPDYFQDSDPYFKLLPIDSLAFELWTISDSITFDNVLITNDVDVANLVVDHTYQLKKDLADEESDNLFVKLIKSTNKKPWLWAVYLLVLAVPVIAFIAYCCVEPVSKARPQESDEEITARKKKTDEVTEDDLNEHSTTRASPPRGKEPTPVRISPPRQVQVEELVGDEEVEEEPATEEEEIEEEVVEEVVVSESGAEEESAIDGQVEGESEVVVEEEVVAPVEEEEEEQLSSEPDHATTGSSKKSKARRRKKSSGR